MMLESILQEQCSLDPDQPVLTGVSGGADSLCLLGILHAAGYRVIVAHFDHKLRPESGQDAEYVRSVAKKMGLPFVAQAGDVLKHAEEERLSIEEAARNLRYRFLFTEARRAGAQAVAVGHTADDQVETVLMHFLRGAGLAGLKGMEYCTILSAFDPEIPLIRPLLSLWRQDTVAYCLEKGLQPREDASNANQAYLRNRIRHSLLPELSQYNPRIKEAMLHMATALQGDHAALQEQLDQAWQDVVSGQGKNWLEFDRPRFSGLSRGLRRNLMRRAGELLRPEKFDPGFEALERAAAFAEAEEGKPLDFINGLYLYAEGGKIYLAAYNADLPNAHWPMAKETSTLQSRQLNLENGWVLTVEDASLEGEKWRWNADPWCAWLDADLAGDLLTVRGRKDGDRFQPLGMDQGSMKLSDFFVNFKLPRRARKSWPLVCAGEEIAWIPGFRIAHPFRVTEKTKRVVMLALKETGRTCKSARSFYCPASCRSFMLISRHWILEIPSFWRILSCSILLT